MPANSLFVGFQEGSSILRQSSVYPFVQSLGAIGLQVVVFLLDLNAIKCFDPVISRLQSALINMLTPPLQKLSVVVPCFNEQEVLTELYRRVTKICRATVDEEYEIILVDDGSRDETGPMIVALSELDPHIAGVGLSRNHGHQLALSAGLSVACGERVFIIDADLQDPPELLPKMMELMDAGADVVYGRRARRAGETWFKKMTAAAFYRTLTRLTDVPIPVDTGDFRLISRRVVDLLNGMPESYRFIRGMISWLGFRQVALDYDRQERFAGSTKYPFGAMIRFAFDAITGFSIYPLRVATALGTAFGVLAFSTIAYALISWIMGTVVPGWTSVIIVVLILGSSQLLLLGVTGEYIGRLYLEAKRRPLFIIDKVIRHPYTVLPKNQDRLREPTNIMDVSDAA
jgi:polyisoprenyl-phosphate glycosyltransferase